MVELLNIDLENIKINDRFRKSFPEKEMELLKESIKEKGIINSIAVKILDENEYLLLAGERRFRACKELEMQTIPARIYPNNITELDEKEIELFENIRRQDMSFQEELKLKKAIFELQIEKYGEKTSKASDAKGVSQRDIATILGESHTNFSNDLRLAKIVEQNPKLFEKVKNKREAHNLVKQLQKKHHEYKILEEFKETKNTQKDENIRPKQALINSYHVENCLNGLKDVVDENAFIVEIDPPYAIDLQNNKRKNFTNLDIDNYNEIDPEEYEKTMKAVFKESYRSARNNAWMICWFSPSFWYDKIFSWATEAGWNGRDLPGLWIKSQGQTNQPEIYLASNVEYFFYFRKGNPMMHKPGHLATFDFKAVPPAIKTHPTERPIELIEEILDTFAFPGSIVQVPFAGSGNTLLAAHNLNMTAYGYDLSEEYKKSFSAKVLEQKEGKFKSYLK